MTKDVMDAIRERRSVRRYESSPVPEPTISRLLEAACMAPSAGNIQPWHFFVVRKEETKALLARAARQAFVGAAPVLIAVCAEPAASAATYGQRGSQLYCIQDTAAAIQNLMLAATGFGLGTCWVGAFDEAAAAQALDLPAGLRPVALIPVGYPAQTPRPTPRRPIQKVVTYLD